MDNDRIRAPIESGSAAHDLTIGGDNTGLVEIASDMVPSQPEWVDIGNIGRPFRFGHIRHMQVDTVNGEPPLRRAEVLAMIDEATRRITEK